MKWFVKQFSRHLLISSPAKIVFIYVLVGVFWVAASNELLVFFVRDPEVLTSIEIVKDWFFILLTAGLLYLLIERALRALRSSEETLQESKRTLTTLLSNLPGMAYRCRNDSSWTMEFVSDGCMELTGYAPQDLIRNASASYAQLIHPEDEAMVWNEVQAALHEKRPFKLIYRIITARGEEKWVWEQGREVPPAGSAVAMLE